RRAAGTCLGGTRDGGTGRAGLVRAGPVDQETGHRQGHQQEEAPDQDDGDHDDQPRETAGLGTDVDPLGDLADVGVGDGVAVDLAAGGLDDAAGEGEAHPELEVRDPGHLQVRLRDRGGVAARHHQMELPVLLGQLHLVAEVGALHHPAGAAPQMSSSSYGSEGTSPYTPSPALSPSRSAHSSSAESNSPWIQVVSIPMSSSTCMVSTSWISKSAVKRPHPASRTSNGRVRTASSRRRQVVVSMRSLVDGSDGMCTAPRTGSAPVVPDAVLSLRA